MITWNTGSAAERFRHNVKMSLHRHNLKLKLKNKKIKNKKISSLQAYFFLYGWVGPQAPSSKLQAALTMDLGDDRMNLEREENMEVEQLKRIADAIEEILRLVKKDMEPKKNEDKI